MKNKRSVKSPQYFDQKNFLLLDNLMHTMVIIMLFSVCVSARLSFVSVYMEGGGDNSCKVARMARRLERSFAYPNQLHIRQDRRKCV